MGDAARSRDALVVELAAPHLSTEQPTATLTLANLVVSPSTEVEQILVVAGQDL